MCSWQFFCTKPKAKHLHPHHLKDGCSHGRAPFLFPRGSSSRWHLEVWRLSHQPAPEVPKEGLKPALLPLNVQPCSGPYWGLGPHDGLCRKRFMYAHTLKYALSESVQREPPNPTVSPRLRSSRLREGHSHKLLNLVMLLLFMVLVLFSFFNFLFNISFCFSQTKHQTLWP